MFSIVAVLALASAARAAHLSLFACVSGSLYEIETATYEANFLGNGCPFTGTLAFANGKLLSTNNDEIVEVAADGSGFKKFITLQGFTVGNNGGFTVDEKANLAYHIQNMQFDSVDLKTGVSKPLAPPPMNNINAIAFDAATNCIYGVDNALFKYDIAKDSWSKVGDEFQAFFNEGDNQQQPIDFNFGGLALLGDTLYASIANSRIFEISKASGKITSFGNRVALGGIGGLTFAPATGCRAEAGGSFCVSVVNGKTAVNCGECPPNSKRSVDEVKTYAPVQVRMATQVTVASKPGHNDCRVASSVEIDGDQVVVRDDDDIYDPTDKQSTEDGDQAFALEPLTTRNDRSRRILLTVGEHKSAVKVRSLYCAKGQVVIDAQIVQVVPDLNGAVTKLDDSSDKK